MSSFPVNRVAANSNTGLLSQTLNLPSANDPIWRAFRSNTGYIGMIVDGRNNEGFGANSIGETNENNNRNLGFSIDSAVTQINQQRQITVRGSIYGVDDERGSDEYGSAFKEQKTTLLQPDSQSVLNMNLRWGGEARVELSLTGQVIDLAGNIQIEGIAKLFEGVTTNTNDLDGQVPVSILIPRGETGPSTIRVSNTDPDEGNDYADITLTFDNTDANQSA